MIYETMTVLTDLLLAVWTGGLALLLWRGKRYPPRSLWALAFVATAFAAGVGGVWHGYSPYWSAGLADLVWKAVLALIGAADALFGWAIVSHCLHGKWRKRLHIVVAVKGGGYLFLLLWIDAFWLAVVDYLPTLLLILILQMPRMRILPAARWLTLGVLTALLAAGIQVSGFKLSVHFDHNDLYHLVQGGALFFLYRGARLFVSPQETGNS